MIDFPPYRLDLRDERLWRDQRAVALRPKTWALLRYLAEHPNVLVEKDELVIAVWGDVAVSDDALTRTISELRRKLHDDPRAPRFIQTVHRRGFRFIAPIDDTIAPAPMLAGRDRELARLWTLFRQACDGTRQIVFVAGEAGSGKTSLVRAFLAELRAGHQAVSILTLPASGNGRSLARTLRQGTLPGRGGLTNGSSAWPLLIVLEDLHATEIETAGLLLALAKRPGSDRVMVIGTYRPSDAVAVDRAGGSSGALAQADGLSVRIVLEPLGREAVAEYLRRRVGFPVEEKVAAMVYEQTGGRPLFVAALADHLIASGRLVAARSRGLSAVAAAGAASPRSAPRPWGFAAAAPGRA